jgi:hypothetical protein
MGNGGDAGEEALITIFVAFQPLRARRRAGLTTDLRIARFQTIAE